jgi:hypothetical protein
LTKCTVGIKESLFDYEHLAAYLLYRLNSISPAPSTPPPYPPPLRKPSKSRPPLALTESTEGFLDELAERMGYLQPGGVRDRQRAAKWFVEWWRNAGGASSDKEAGNLNVEVEIGGSEEWGWGLDCQWADRDEQHPSPHSEEPSSKFLTIDPTISSSDVASLPGHHSKPSTLDSKFDQVVSQYMNTSREVDGEVSETQLKKREKGERMQRRMEKGSGVAKKRADSLKRRSKR